MYDKGVKVFPAKDLIFYQADIYSNEITKDRMKVLRAILEGKPITVVTTFDSLMTPMIPLEVLKKNILEISHGSIVEEKAIALKLSSMGYRKVATVEEAGQFAIRGGIVDIFDLTMENPIRLELWGDEVDSIRIFDVQTQRSLSKIDKAVIYPACEFLVSEDVKQDGFKKIEKEVKNSWVEKQIFKIHLKVKCKHKTIFECYTDHSDSYYPIGIIHDEVTKLELKYDDVAR
jgi:transcription-repair coupling factor (superfamily II helicase)